MDFFLPELQMNMVVTTPYHTLPNITPNKKYVISRMERDIIWLRNDFGEITPYKAINFIEADVFFALCLYMTFMKLLNLSNKPLDSLEN
jgi:hypothetical protein